MTQRKILVTGGAGFIGSNFVHTLLENKSDISITVVDKLTYAGNFRNLERWKDDSRFLFIKSDIADKEDLFSKLEGHNFQEIAHFAAESHVDRSILGPEEFVKTNVLGTFYMLELARELHSAGKLKVFLHVSTDEVFGSLGEDGAFTESTSYAPNSPYSASKAGSDHLVRAYFHTHNLPITISNCSNNYGPYQFPEKLIPLFVTNLIEGKKVPMYGKGENVRDWIHVDDHNAGVEAIIKKGKIGETYCLGGGNEKSNMEITKLILESMGFGEKMIEYVADRKGHDLRYAIDYTKAKTELCWEPKINFEEGLRQTIGWIKNNESWWKNIKSGDYQEYYTKQYGK